MSFIIVVLCLALLIVLISYFKVDAFIAFLISSILAGIALGIPLEKLPDSVNNGIGSILGGLTLIIVLGAMLSTKKRHHHGSDLLCRSALGHQLAQHSA